MGVWPAINLVDATSTTLNPGQYLVICDTGLIPSVPPTALYIDLGSISIQNGGSSPDAMGIFDLSTNTLIDALSYDGSVVAGVVSGIGTFNFVEGNATTVVEDGSSPNLSLIRSPNGSDTDDALTDWAVSSGPSFGVAN